MSRFFTGHARDRAHERYGFYPTIRELSAVLMACQGGQGCSLMRTSSNGSKTYCVEMRGVRVYPVISPDGLVIVTFRPKDFFVASQARKHRLEVSNATARKPKERSHEKDYLPREPYRREKITLATLRSEDI